MARVVVIGGGFGGLASAARLAKLGHDVTLLEAAARIGGALGYVEEEGFRWDSGPTTTLLPAVIRDFFRKSGRPAEKEIDLVPVEPVQQHRFADGTLLDLPGGSRAAQLEAFDAATPGLALARILVADHLEALARHDRTRICQRLRVEEADFETSLALIRSLSPKPGSGFSGAAAEYVAPDAYARKVNGRWQVALAPGCQPRLGINEHYAGLIAKARRDDANYLKGQLQEARWLIKSLKTRAETMLKVATSIVRAQEAFLEFGPEAMRPLVLKDVAEEIGMHESTISRVTTRKFLHTPRGTFEFKYFFSSGVTTVDGGAASATAIQAMIKKLIGEEGAARPLSDQVLAAELNRRGINVARRTVAKYREALNIPSSNDRSRLG